MSGMNNDQIHHGEFVTLHDLACFNIFYFKNTNVRKEKQKAEETATTNAKQ